MPCTLERERSSQPQQASLCRGVARLTEPAERPRDGRHVDDPPPPPLLHVRPDGLGAVERSGQVHAEVAFPELRHLIGKLPDVVERAGVVDEDVDRAELVDHAAHGLFDLCPIGDIALDRRRAPPQVRDLLRRRLRIDEPLRARGLRQRPVTPGVLPGVGLDLDVRDHDVRAGTGERQRIGATEPA